MIGLKRLFLSN